MVPRTIVVVWDWGEHPIRLRRDLVDELGSWPVEDLSVQGYALVDSAAVDGLRDVTAAFSDAEISIVEVGRYEKHAAVGHLTQNGRQRRGVTVQLYDAERYDGEPLPTAEPVSAAQTGPAGAFVLQYDPADLVAAGRSWAFVLAVAEHGRVRPVAGPVRDPDLVETCHATVDSAGVPVGDPVDTDVAVVQSESRDDRDGAETGRRLMADGGHPNTVGGSGDDSSDSSSEDDTLGGEADVDSESGSASPEEGDSVDGGQADADTSSTRNGSSDETTGSDDTPDEGEDTETTGADDTSGEGEDTETTGADDTSGEGEDTETTGDDAAGIDGAHSDEVEELFRFMNVRPPEATDDGELASIDPERSEGLISAVWTGDDAVTQEEAVRLVEDYRQSDQFVRSADDLSLDFGALRRRLADAQPDESFGDLVEETVGTSPGELADSEAFETTEGRLLDSLASVSVQPGRVSAETKTTIHDGVRLADAIRRAAAGDEVDPTGVLDRHVTLPSAVTPLSSLPTTGTDAVPMTGPDQDVAELARQVQRLETAKRELQRLSGGTAGDVPDGDEGALFDPPETSAEVETEGDSMAQEEPDAEDSGATGEEPRGRRSANASRIAEFLADIDSEADALSESVDDIAESLADAVDDAGRLVGALFATGKPSSATLTEADYDGLSEATRSTLADLGVSPGESSLSEATDLVAEEATRTTSRLLDSTVGGYERLVETEDGPLLLNDAVDAGSTGATAASVPLSGSFTGSTQFGEFERASPGVTPLGFGELRQVQQVGPRYEAGEVAHIENVMASETRERVHRESTVTEETTRREEQTTTTETEDLQTTRRSEIKQETEEVINEEWGVEAGVNVSAKYGPVSIDTSFGYSRQESKQKSERTTVETAQEITKRATRRVEKKVTTETIRRVREEITERNRHAFENDTGSHIIGIYRWLDKTYRMDVHEYDKPRLMFEFLIPDPAAGYRYAQRAKPKVKTAEKPVEPQAVRFKNGDAWYDPRSVDEGVEREEGDPVYLERLSYDDITPTNYRWYATHYGAEDVPEPPDPFTYKVQHLTKQSKSSSKGKGGYGQNRDFTDFGEYGKKEIDVPQGYEVAEVRFVSDTWYRLNRKIAAVLRVGVGAQGSQIVQKIPHTDKKDKAENPASHTFVFKGQASGATVTNVDDRSDNNYDRLPVTVMARNIDDYSVVALARLERTSEHLREWKADVYDAIMRAYEERRREYESEVESARIGQGVDIEGRNPKANREIERTELKRSAIELLRGSKLDVDAVETPAESDSVSFPEILEFEVAAMKKDLQFYEQAFEWMQGTYVFYPYYWADPDTWVSKMTRTNADPKFETFLTAGAARFVVPVRPGFEPNVLLFMQTGIPFLKEGAIEDINDDRYVDIVTELREQDDAMAGSEYTGNHWFDTVPTSLVKLQASDTLPNLITPVGTLYPNYSGAQTTSPDGGYTDSERLLGGGESTVESLLNGGWDRPNGPKDA